MNSQDSNLKKIKIQLNWKHQFQFAGLYAAIEKGYYKNAGFDVELIETTESDFNYDKVNSGDIEFGIGRTDLILERVKGNSPVLIAAIFQHSPQVLIASKDLNVINIHNFNNKKISLEPNSMEIISYLKEEGIEIDKSNIKIYKYDIDSFINKNIDAISAYTTDELYILNKLNFDYNIYSPASSGIDFYGDILFTSEIFLKKNPELVDNFIKATLKGWDFAMKNKSEIINLIFNKYTQRHSIEHLTYEANQMDNYIYGSFTEIGVINRNKIENIISIYKKLGFINKNYETHGLLLEDFKLSNSFPWQLILILSILIITVIIIVLLFYRLNTKLKKEIVIQQETNKQLEESKRNYKLIADNMHDALLIIDPDSLEFKYLSPSVYFILGYKVNELLNKSLNLVFSHENIQILKAVIHNKIQYSTKELNIPFIKIANLIRKDGSVVTTEINAKFFYNNQISKFQIIATARDISEKRKIELALKNNEKQLRSIIETSPEGIGITNLSGEISYASKKLLEIFGYESIDQIIGKKLIDFIQIDYQEKALYFLNEMLNGNHTGTAEYLAIKKDGSEIFIESNANILFEEDRPTGILLISRDVTDRKLSENLLIESENRLKLIVETSPDAIISTSLDGKIMTASNQAAKIFGYSNPSELLGKYTLDFIHPDYLETAKIRMTERILQGNTNPFEYLMIKKDSSHIFIEATASLLKNKYQKPMGLIYIARDITERKIVEKNLAESKERYKTLVESANEGISVILNFEIVFINKKICEIIDTNSEKLLNKSILEYVVDEDIDLVSNYFNSFDHTLYSNDNFEFRIITRNNNVKWLEIKTVLIEWNGSKASLNFINDITYKKNAEIELFRIYEDLRISNEEIEVNLFQKNTLIEELENTKSTLEKVNSTKDKFFSIIAHDLRNPLGNFRTTTKLLFDSYDDFQEEERLEFLEVIKNSADNIYSLLENLLEWSRAQRGSIEFRPDNFDLYYLIENNISLLRLSASNKRVTLKNNVKFSTYLFADINLITTIIRNLISNAIKFTPTDGEIAIGITSNENENIISIKDSGVGMNQDTLNKLFRIDTNFSTLGTSSERGTGLGLILCKEFVDLHNGKIWAESEFGKGSTFFFSIPKN